MRKGRREGGRKEGRRKEGRREEEGREGGRREGKRKKGGREEEQEGGRDASRDRKIKAILHSCVDMHLRGEGERRVREKSSS